MQQPSSDHRRAEHEDCTGEVDARPPGEQSQCGAPEPKCDVQKDGVGAHGLGFLRRYTFPRDGLIVEHVAM